MSHGYFHGSLLDLTGHFYTLPLIQWTTGLSTYAAIYLCCCPSLTVRLAPELAELFFVYRCVHVHAVLPLATPQFEVNVTRASIRARTLRHNATVTATLACAGVHLNATFFMRSTRSTCVIIKEDIA